MHPTVKKYLLYAVSLWIGWKLFLDNPRIEREQAQAARAAHQHPQPPEGAKP